jgi:hypothetical protein
MKESLDEQKQKKEEGRRNYLIIKNSIFQNSNNHILRFRVQQIGGE